MKSGKVLLSAVCCLLLVFAAAQAETATPPETARFSSGDMNVNYVYLGADEAQAEAVFRGEHTVEAETSAATGETQQIWQYEGLTLTFGEGGMLIGAAVADPAYTGPRGLKLGMTAQEVSALFYQDPDPEHDALFYAAGYVDALSSYLPPCGFVQRDADGTFTFLYLAPVTPYGDDVKADPGNFLFQDTAQLIVQFNADGTVVSFTCRQSALAE